MQIGRILNKLKREVLSCNIPAVDLVCMKTADPYKTLVTAILSARTKDETTLSAARRLFLKAKNLCMLEKLKVRDIEKLIYPVGFYKNKARALKQMPKIINKNFNGKIPDTFENLIELPGVGRKTANLVLAVSFNKHAICVDTHVHRIMNRIGYVKTETPHETEIELRKKLPKKYWRSINSILVAFGQNICRPVSPFCSKCVIRKYCNKVGVKRRR